MPLVRPPQPTSSPSITPQARAQFKPCPRPEHVAGHNDWLQITSPKPFTNFDICPDCYNTSLRNTRYERYMSQIPARPKHYTVQCDFSNTWVRIAYAWLFAQNAPDLTLLGNVGQIQPDEDGVCPNSRLEDPEIKKGKKPAVTRKWYCIQHPMTGALIEDLTACSHCVAHINIIFPNLKGMFCPVAGGQKLLATCDLMTIDNGQARFLEYIDRITHIAERTLATGTRDTSPLAKHIKKWAGVPICKKDNAVTGVKRYSFPSIIPDFDACEECYLKHIQPLYETSPQPHILAQIQSSVPTTGGFMCDLYSPRVQQYFRDACATNDLQTFRQKTTARCNKMREVVMQLERMGHECRQLKLQSRSHMNQMHVERTRARSNGLLWATSAWSAPPIDWGATNAHMAQGNQLAMKAAMVQDNMTNLKREWENYWE